MYRSPIEMLITDIEHQIVKQQDEEIYQAVLHHIPNIDKEELIRALQYDRNQYEKGYADGVKEFSVKIAECLKRYSHLHKYANEARRREEEFADGTPMEMVSVWDVLPLEKWGAAKLFLGNICDIPALSQRAFGIRKKSSSQCKAIYASDMGVSNGK